MAKQFIDAPSLADITQGHVEVKLEEKIRASFAPNIANYFLQYYLRYLDDIYFRWKIEWLTELTIIEESMNSIDPKIVYEFERSSDNNDNALPFLDVRVIIAGNSTQTDIYAKNTDTFNYVPFNSCHPRHTIRNIPLY